MDCFPGAVTSVDTYMTHDRCVETTFLYDTGSTWCEGFTRCWVSKSSRRNISKYWTTTHSCRGANQDDSGGMSDSLDDSMTSWWGTSSRTWRYAARLRWHRRSQGAHPRLLLTLTGKQRLSESTIFNDKEVWSLVSWPTERQRITGKWHFALKVNEDGTVTKYRWRFVARSFTQTPGLDYHETYTPTVRVSTLRTVLACGWDRASSSSKWTQRQHTSMHPSTKKFFGSRRVQAGQRRHGV